MGVISLDYVISYSSQDKTFKAENLLQNPGSGKSWLCAPDDRTGRLVAEFQLTKASRIDFIDIGNHGSSTVEIQVGRSCFQSKTHYVSFLPAVTLLSLADLKESVDRNAVYMFNKSNLNETAASDKWDRIKVICCQPYRKNTQFGLSFLSLRTNELMTEFSINDQSSLSDKNDRSPFKRSKEYGPDLTFTRGKQLLNASRSKITQGEEKPHSPTFEEDVNVFLIACLGEENENKTLEDYMKEFEEQSQQRMNTTEKVIFRINYMKIRGNAFISEYNPEDSFSRKQDSRAESSLLNPKINSDESEVPSFDLQLSTPRRRKLSDSDEADKMKRALKRLKTPAKPSKVAEILNVNPEDFIQSDGVQPSTSSGVTYVDCPICRESFTSQEIERHASTCGDLTGDVEYLYSSKPNALRSEEKEETFVTCLFCDELYPEGFMYSHMDRNRNKENIAMDSNTEAKSKLETVKVVVRCRPMSEKEGSANYQKVVKLYPDRGGIEVQMKSLNTKYFTFDAVYDGGNQADIYDEVFRPLVDSVINGFNGTVIAYGQTGAGKTYTMEGQLGDPEKEGVIPNSFRNIFSHIARSENTQFLVSASYIEIYQEEVRDLLSPDPKRKLEVRERNDTGVYVKDLTVIVCKTVEELEKVMVDGKHNRSIGTTNMNAHSSRSHAIFMISIESCATDLDGNTHVKIGKLNLVDLAGSEKQAKTGAVGSTQKESIKINLSLSALGNVISALVDGKSTHVPYRDSKLTRLLQDSLGGNAKTIMIANIGPASYNLEETITTLRYANRAKNIKNKPVVNVDPKDAILLQFKQEISQLKAQLALKEAKRKKKKETTKITEDETIEDELDPSSVEIVKKMENLLQEERVAYLNEQNLMAEEKEKIMRDIKAKDEELRLENEAKEKIKQQLQELEAKLLCGGKNIIDHTNEQQRILEKRRQELAEQKRIEREIQTKLLEEEESTLEKKETYDSLQQEVDMKTKKLKKLFQRFQTLKDDINDESEINSFERQDKEQTIEALTRDLKLSNLVIDNFVNPEDKEKFLEHVKYDEDEDAYVIFPSEMSYSHFNPAERPASANHLRRPMTSHAIKMTKLHSARPRYKSENIVVVDLAVPRKRTIDHYEPEMDPYAREAIKNMLADQVINVQLLRQNVEKSPEPVQRTLGRFGARTSSNCGRQLKSKADIEQYPVPRGLVPK